MKVIRQGMLPIMLTLIGIVLVSCFHGPGNDAPKASIEAEPLSGPVPLTVEFSAATTDPDGTVVFFLWAFGDGNGAQGRTVSYTYTKPGTYTVSLTVEDDHGNTAQAEKTIEVSGSGCRKGADETNGLRVSINNVRRTDSIARFQAGEGRTYVVVDLTVRAKQSDRRVDAFNFRVEVSNETVVSPASASRRLDGMLEGGRLGAGEEMSGKLAFEIPDDVSYLSLSYSTKQNKEINICLTQ